MKYFLSVGLILLPFEVAIVLEQRHKRIDAETLEELKALSPSDFEKLVAETYRAQGHKVEIVGATGDHGIDLVVKTRKGETWIVQCKKYRGKVGEPVIRDFYGALRASDADAGAVITTGLITTQARLWAEGKPIFLYDGDEFLDVMKTTRIRKSLPAQAIKKAAPAPAASAAPMSMPMMQTAYATASIASAPVVVPAYDYSPAKEVAKPEPVTAYVASPAVSMDIPAAYDEYPPQDKRPFMNMDTAPVCPACGVPMILHSEKRFLFKPKEEYICQNAPSCPETMPVD